VVASANRVPGLLFLGPGASRVCFSSGLPRLGSAFRWPRDVYPDRVDPHSLSVLEFPAVLDLLAAETAFIGGHRLALALEPATDPALVARRQARTAEALRLDALGSPELVAAADIREDAARAARAMTLDPEVLFEIALTLRAALGARRTVLALREELPLLAARLDAISPALDQIALALEQAVDQEGVLDGASPRLRGLRRDHAVARERAAERLREMAASLRSHLQEEFLTERSGRPVLAVRADARSAVPGIVHDASGSGQTIFVEPFVLVEQHNRLRELASEEREEIARILSALSGLVGASAGDIAAAVDALSELDLAMASARLAQRTGGCPVQQADDVELAEARHPLLDPRTAVPIDLPLAGIRTLVVSGANAGGKTVALKTLGLAAAMHQCGLRPPARSARLPVYRQILADVGDEQSIARSLSTFSGHLRSIAAIVSVAGRGTLVLLDEVAAGTDPIEGAALARALLEALQTRGAQTLATTHYPELKEWAAGHEGAENASVGFDAATLAPTFTLTVGRPGASHALQMAARLGLDMRVVEAARAGVAPERLELEELLAAAAESERRAARALGEAEQRRAEAVASAIAVAERERELRAEIERVEASAQAVRERALADAERELAGERRELDALRAEIRAARAAERARKDRPAAPDASGDERERDRRLGAASERVRRASRMLTSLETVPRRGPLGVGDPVVAPSLGVRGVIAEIAGDEAEVHAGALRVRVPLTRLEADPQGRASVSPEPDVKVRASAPSDVADELDVRGGRADDAREAARAYVDAAHLAGRGEVRIIHGRGTGALRKAVRDELARHPLVDEAVSDSADGATIVRIAGNSS
jgi:DNA mismatch repair protein MutS2